MTIRRTIELAVFALALLIAAMAVHAWLAARAEQRQLTATLSQQKQLLDAADARERTRQSALSQTLAKIESLKRSTQTPQQIVSAIPQFVPLPQPITLMANQQGTTPPKSGLPSSSRGFPETGLPSAPTAQIPNADLKPLYDYIQDCRAFQAQLAAAKANATDDASKITALTTERDAALTAAKGGTFWRRLRQNALWFAAGAAVTVAATHSHQGSKRALNATTNQQPAHFHDRPKNY